MRPRAHSTVALPALSALSYSFLFTSARSGSLSRTRSGLLRRRWTVPSPFRRRSGSSQQLRRAGRSGERSGRRRGVAPERARRRARLMPARCGAFTHARNRAVAMDGASRLGSANERLSHRSVEFEKFLKRIDAETPAGLDIHLILDNYSTHKSPRTRRWLARHPRFHLHFTPTYSSWLNLVERWFAELTTRQLRRGVHRSVAALERAIRKFLDQPTPPPARSSGRNRPKRSSRASPDSRSGRSRRTADQCFMTHLYRTLLDR